MLLIREGENLQNVASSSTKTKWPKPLSLNVENKEKEDDAAALIRYEKHLEEQEIKRKHEMEERENRMQARMNKMKETVIDKLGLKEKEEELKQLREVQNRENKEDMKEKSNKMRVMRDQEKLREFLAIQVEEKKQISELEKEK